MKLKDKMIGLMYGRAITFVAKHFTSEAKPASTLITENTTLDNRYAKQTNRARSNNDRLIDDKVWEFFALNGLPATLKTTPSNHAIDIYRIFMQACVDKVYTFNERENFKKALKSLVSIELPNYEYTPEVLYWRVQIVKNFKLNSKVTLEPFSIRRWDK